MTAEEARLKTIAVRGEDLEPILKEIAAKAEKGEFSAWWYKKIRIDTKASLKNLGYKVGDTSYNQIDGHLTEISWR